MSNRLRHIASFVPAALLWSLSMSLSACNGKIDSEVIEPQDTVPEFIWGAMVYRDDSTEWHVWVPIVGVYVYEDYMSYVDSTYHVPTHEEAKILKTITYGPSGQRYLTNDGYTFGMPSANITKAGTKTKYSVLALWRRRYIINQGF